jgi:hypothetical protein
MSPEYRRFVDGTFAVSGCYFCWHFAAQGDLFLAFVAGAVAAIYLHGLFPS